MFWWGDGFYIDNNGNYFIGFDTPVGIVVDKKIEAYFENKREP